MQQPCSRCGYISDRPARFCRQCGSQLFAETEATRAATRTYTPQTTPPQLGDRATAYSSYGGDYGSNEQPPDTSPFYRPPVVPQYQYPAVEQRSPNWGRWILISVVTFLLLSILAGGALFYWGKRMVDQAARQAAGEGSVVVIPEPPPVPDAPNAPPPPGTARSLDNFKYPGARVTESHRVPFSETITMTTGDDTEKVKKFYEEKFKEHFKNSPTSISYEEDERKYTFASLNQPMLTIEVEPDADDRDKTRISITQVNVPIPKIEIPEIEIPKIEIRKK